LKIEALRKLRGELVQVPAGQKKIARSFNCGINRKKRQSPVGAAEISSVPAGLDVFPACPGIEMPGYFRWFLRNRTPAQNGGAASREFGQTSNLTLAAGGRMLTA